MGLRVRLHARARADLEAIRDYLLEHAGKQAAERVRSHLRSRIARLALLPQLGTPTSHPDVRALAPTKYPFLIY